MNILKLSFLFCFLLYATNLLAQYYPNGDKFTPKGHLHCLIIFVTYVDASNGTSLFLNSNGQPLTNSYFTSNNIPDFALNDGLITD